MYGLAVNLIMSESGHSSIINDISICFHFLNTQFFKAFVLKITLTENRSVTGPIKGGTLFKGGHYFRKYGISICFHFLNTQFSKAFVLKITLTENRSVTGPCAAEH